MNITLDPELLGHVALIVFMVTVAYALLWMLPARIRKLEAFNRGLIAHAKLQPVAPDKFLIDKWRARYDELADSPKKTAYRNRLIEVGVMDANGHYIDGAKGGD